jgi:hypothetical protein
MARYTIKQVNEKDFVEYTSPSVVLGQLSKGDMLVQWSADMTADYIKSYSTWIIESKNITSVAIDNIIQDARYAWKNKRDNTADIGSELHALIETYINLRIKNTNIDDFLNHIKRKTGNIKIMFYQFMIWEKKNVKRFIESEKTVVHTNLCYAGTLDFCYEGFDDKVYCVDIKTTSFKPYKQKDKKTDYKMNMYYKDHEIQVVSYKYAREAMTGSYVVCTNTHDKTIVADNIKIDGCKVLYIERDFFNLIDHDVKEVKLKQKSFEALLVYFYTSAKRRLKNNKRAEQRA